MEEEKSKAKIFESSVAELEASKRMVESLKEQLSILEVLINSNMRFVNIN